MTAASVAATGIDEPELRALVEGFYGKVRTDPVLGPIFAGHIADWAVHIERMVTFWSSVALMTGRYHGRPVPAHTKLPVGALHFERWLALFRKTAGETCSPEGAAHIIVPSERIARSLLSAVEESQLASEPIPACANQRLPR